MYYWVGWFKSGRTNIGNYDWIRSQKTIEKHFRTDLRKFESLPLLWKKWMQCIILSNYLWLNSQRIKTSQFSQINAWIIFRSFNLWACVQQQRLEGTIGYCCLTLHRHQMERLIMEHLRSRLCEGKYEESGCGDG